MPPCEEDKLFFVERMVADGFDDYSWEVEDSFYSQESASLCAKWWNSKGHTVRVTHGNQTTKELVGA